MSFLQSKSWQEFQEHIGRKTWNIEHGSVKTIVIELDLPLKQSYLYIPRGPLMDLDINEEGGIRNNIEYMYRKLVEIGEERKSVFIKIEPESDNISQLIFQEDLRKSSRNIQPYKTVLVDLSKSDEELTSLMHHKTRYNINVAKKNNIEIRESKDIDSFLKLLKKSSEHNKFHGHLASYYKSMYDFLSTKEDMDISIQLAYLDGKEIAGGIFLGFGDTMHYLHGGMDREYRNLMAPHLLHWEVMQMARSKGYSKYDFWGIDERAYPGVTRFKLGWGGQVVEYPGSFDLPLKGFKYWALNIIRKFR